MGRWNLTADATNEEIEMSASSLGEGESSIQTPITDYCFMCAEPLHYQVALPCCKFPSCDTCCERWFSTCIRSGRFPCCPGGTCGTLSSRFISWTRLIDDNDRNTVLHMTRPEESRALHSRNIRPAERRSLHSDNMPRPAAQRAVIDVLLRMWQNLSAQAWFQNLLTQWWLIKYTLPCPGCSAPISRSDGCHLLRCPRCHTRLCFLCGSERLSPHDHFCTFFRKVFVVNFTRVAGLWYLITWLGGTVAIYEAVFAIYEAVFVVTSLVNSWARLAVLAVSGLHVLHLRRHFIGQFLDTANGLWYLITWLPTWLGAMVVIYKVVFAIYEAVFTFCIFVVTSLVNSWARLAVLAVSGLHVLHLRRHFIGQFLGTIGSVSCILLTVQGWMHLRRDWLQIVVVRWRGPAVTSASADARSFPIYFTSKLSAVSTSRLSFLCASSLALGFFAQSADSRHPWAARIPLLVGLAAAVILTSWVGFLRALDCSQRNMTFRMRTSRGKEEFVVALADHPEASRSTSGLFADSAIFAIAPRKAATKSQRWKQDTQQGTMEALAQMPMMEYEQELVMKRAELCRARHLTGALWLSWGVVPCLTVAVTCCLLLGESH